MKYGTATAAFIGLSLALGGNAQAQDFDRDYDDVRAAQSADNSVMVRFAAPFGGHNETTDAPRLSLRMNQDIAGDMRSLDIVSYSFGPNQDQRISTPFRMNAAGDGGGGVFGWIADHPILFGVGAGLVIWGIVEASEDDDEAAPPPPS